MQELMSRHKTYSLSPRDCLKTCLFQKWQRMVAPPGRRTTCWDIDSYKHINLQYVSVTLSLCPFSAAEPSRQAPNKRRKRKMSGGSTISGGGGTNNNNNNKKKSPGSGFPLSSQVPVSTSLLSSVRTVLLHLQQKHHHYVHRQTAASIHRGKVTCHNSTQSRTQWNKTNKVDTWCWVEIVMHSKCSSSPEKLFLYLMAQYVMQRCVHTVPIT